MACPEDSAQHCRPGLRAPRAPAPDAGVIERVGQEDVGRRPAGTLPSNLRQTKPAPLAGGQPLTGMFRGMPVRFVRFQRLRPGPGSTYLKFSATFQCRMPEKQLLVRPAG